MQRFFIEWCHRCVGRRSGYPILFDFLPNIDAFYREWLKRPLAEETGYKDMTSEVIKAWR
jgi:acetone carboxylase gamma subunit